MPRKYTHAMIISSSGRADGQGSYLLGPAETDPVTTNRILPNVRQALGIPYPEHPRNRQLAMAR